MNPSLDRALKAIYKGEVTLVDEVIDSLEEYLKTCIYGFGDRNLLELYPKLLDRLFSEDVTGAVIDSQPQGAVGQQTPNEQQQTQVVWMKSQFGGWLKQLIQSSSSNNSINRYDGRYNQQALNANNKKKTANNKSSLTKLVQLLDPSSNFFAYLNAGRQIEYHWSITLLPVKLQMLLTSKPIQQMYLQQHPMMLEYLRRFTSKMVYLPPEKNISLMPRQVLSISSYKYLLACLIRYPTLSHTFFARSSPSTTSTPGVYSSALATAAQQQQQQSSSMRQQSPRISDKIRQSQTNHHSLHLPKAPYSSSSSSSSMMFMEQNQHVCAQWIQTIPYFMLLQKYLDEILFTTATNTTNATDNSATTPTTGRPLSSGSGAPQLQQQQQQAAASSASTSYLQAQREYFLFLISESWINLAYHHQSSSAPPLQQQHPSTTIKEWVIIQRLFQQESDRMKQQYLIAATASGANPGGAGMVGAGAAGASQLDNNRRNNNNSNNNTNININNNPLFTIERDRFVCVSQDMIQQPLPSQQQQQQPAASCYHPCQPIIFDTAAGTNLRWTISSMQATYFIVYRIFQQMFQPSTQQRQLLPGGRGGGGQQLLQPGVGGINEYMTYIQSYTDRLQHQQQKQATNLPAATNMRRMQAAATGRQQQQTSSPPNPLQSPGDYLYFLQVPIYEMLLALFSRQDFLSNDDYREVVAIAVEIWLLWMEPWKTFRLAFASSSTSYATTAAVATTPTIAAFKRMYIVQQYHFYTSLLVVFMKAMSKRNFHPNSPEGKDNLMLVGRVLDAYSVEIIDTLSSYQIHFRTWYAQQIQRVNPDSPQVLSPSAVTTGGVMLPGLRTPERPHLRPTTVAYPANSNITTAAIGATAVNGEPSIIELLVWQDHHERIVTDEPSRCHLEDMGITNLQELLLEPARDVVLSNGFLHTHSFPVQGAILEMADYLITRFGDYVMHFLGMQDDTVLSLSSGSTAHIKNRFLQSLPNLYTTIHPTASTTNSSVSTVAVGSSVDSKAEPLSYRDPVTGKLTNTGKQLLQEGKLKFKAQDMQPQSVYSHDPLELPIFSYEWYPLCILCITLSKWLNNHQQQEGQSSNLPRDTKYLRLSYNQILLSYSWREWPRIIVYDSFRWNLRWLASYRCLAMISLLIIWQVLLPKQWMNDRVGMGISLIAMYFLYQGSFPSYTIV